MKTINLTQNDALKQSEIARDIARTEVVKDALQKAQNELNTIQAKFDVAMAKQQTYMAEEEEKHLKIIETLKIEVKELEERQKVAHFPIAPAERKAYDNLQRSEQELHKAKLQVEKNEDIGDKLQDKLDSLSDRDSQLDRREMKVKQMETSALDQKVALQSLSEELSKKWSLFHLAVAEQDNHTEEEMKLISLHNKDLSAREDKLLEAQMQIERDKEKIQSDRQTLQAALLEINNKKKNGKK